METIRQALLFTVLCFLLGCFALVDAKFCRKLIPGLEKMVKGVDITSLDIVPLDLKNDNGFKDPVINFTCASGKQWTSPWGVEYDLPDEVWYLSQKPGGWTTGQASIYKNSEDVRKNMGVEVGVSASFGPFGFSASAGYKKMQQTLTQSSRYITEIGAYESGIQVDLVPSKQLELNQFALNDVSFNLKDTFKSNPLIYNDFIAQYGTHYFTSAQFGGYIRAIYETKSEYFNSKSDESIKASVAANFASIVSVSVSTETGSSKEEKQFSESSTNMTKYYGGNTNLLGKNALEAWQKTVPLAPWLFSGKLKPISDLIKNETIKSSMVDAVYTYVMRLYLDELYRLVTNAQKRFNGDRRLEQLQFAIAIMKKKPFLVQADVNALSKDVNDQLSIPEWFEINTYLCLRWRADGDENQCNLKKNDILCATLDNMTPAYLDTTDSRAGGCYLRWSLQVKQFVDIPFWFKHVKLCFKTICNSDASTQREVCTPVNIFSPEHKDDTGNGLGDVSCQIAWKITIPEQAPLWMTTIELCFTYTGDTGLCWAPSWTLCAKVNEWTKYYTDSTKNANGGCTMKWGVRIAPLA